MGRMARSSRYRSMLGRWIISARLDRLKTSCCISCIRWTATNSICQAVPSGTACGGNRITPAEAQCRGKGEEHEQYEIDLPGGPVGNGLRSEPYHGGGDIAPRQGEGDRGGGDGSQDRGGSPQFQVGRAGDRWHEEKI